MNSDIFTLAPAGAKEKLKRLLSKKRYLHSVETAKTSLLLSKKSGINIKKAVTAGLLHDCAKDLSTARTRHYMKKYRIKIDEVSLKIPALYHCFTGPHVAREVFKVRDREVLEAIRHHTVGSPDMGAVAKVVYVADFTEESRKYKGSERVRRLLKKNTGLDSLVYEVLSGKLCYLISKDKIIHESAVDLWNELVYNLR